MKFLFAVIVLATIVAISSAQLCSRGYNYNSKVGVCFKYYTQRVVYEVAKSQCQADGSVLPSIHSAMVAEYMTDRLSRLGIGLWLGIQRSTDGAWAWSDGTQLDFENWVTGYPSNGADETCAFIAGNEELSERGWRNWACDGLELGFICIMPAS